MASFNDYFKWGVSHGEYIMSPDAAIVEIAWLNKWGSDELEKAREDIEKNGVKSPYYQQIDQIHFTNQVLTVAGEATILAAPILLIYKLVKAIRKR